MLSEGDHWYSKDLQFCKCKKWNAFFNYVKKALLKIVENLLSVKVWGLVASIWIPTYLLVNNHITGDNWVTVVTGIWICIFGIREAYKVGRVFSEVKKKVIEKVTGTTEPKKE